LVVITSYFGEVAAESPAIAGYIVTVVTREGGVRAQDYGHHMDKPHLILTVELRGRFRFRLAPLDVAAAVREKLLSSARVQEQSVASFPRQSLLSSFAVRLPWLVSLFLSHFQGEAYEVLARYMLNIIFLLPCFFFFFFFSNFLFLLDWVHCFTSYLLLVLLFLRQQNGLLWL
jgi:hypothetical protein